MEYTDIDFNRFRTNLRDLIDSQGYSVRDVAIGIDVAPATMSRYLQAHREPDLIYASRLAQFFGVSLDWLLGLSQDKVCAPTPDVQDIINLYAYASSDDRRIIRAVLRKYESKVRKTD